MSIADIKKTAEQKMTRSVESFKAELQKIRTGRAHPGILDQVHVEYYGSHVPISQVANVTLLDARTISVQPWEKGMGAKIEKAIRESDLGLNPAAQGDLLRVPMPALTEERRKELTKVVRHAAEEAKIAIRNLRRHAAKLLGRAVLPVSVRRDHQERREAGRDHEHVSVQSAGFHGAARLRYFLKAQSVVQAQRDPQVAWCPSRFS